MKTEGIYEIRSVFSPRDLPISRMRVEFVCEHCNYRRLMMQGKTPNRSVTIELNPEGYLLNCEYLHPDGEGARPAINGAPFPERGRCPKCHIDSVLPFSISTIC